MAEAGEEVRDSDCLRWCGALGQVYNQFMCGIEDPFVASPDQHDILLVIACLDILLHPPV